MPKRGAAAARGTPDKGARQQLERVLASRTFQPAERLKRFLNFIVCETLAGRGDQLKEYVIAVQVFGKEHSFDPRTDPLVRVQARRLRSRLVRYYRDEGQKDDLVIELPKGGYAPVLKPREDPAPQKRSVAAALAAQNTVAVLAFSDDSPERSLGYFCKGLRDELVHQLSRLSALRVLTTDAGRASGAADPAHAAERLDAAMAVTGGVRLVANRLRVTVQLVDGLGGRYLWSESIDGTLADPFALQEQVAAAVVRRLEPEVSGLHGVRWSRPVSVNLAAKNLYLQGRYHLNQRTESALQKALEFFDKAVGEDPQYALAHSGLADAYGLLGHYAVLPPADVWTKTASSAATAVMLDGNSAEARTSLAHVKSTQDWDWLGAEREFQRAIGLDPRYPTAHHWYAVSCLVPMGRLDEALEEMRVAQSLDPISSIIARDLAIVHYYRRDFESALEQCDQTIELNPHFSPAYWLLGFIQEQRRDLDESIAAFQRAVHLAPQSPRMQSALARALAVSGQRETAVKMLRTLMELGKQRYVSPFEFAAMHFALGETDRGFRWLSKALDDRAFELTAIRFDPRVEAARPDARFAAIVKRLGLE